MRRILKKIGFGAAVVALPMAIGPSTPRDLEYKEPAAQEIIIEEKTAERPVKYATEKERLDRISDVFRDILSRTELDEKVFYTEVREFLVSEGLLTLEGFADMEEAERHPSSYISASAWRSAYFTDDPFEGQDVQHVSISTVVFYHYYRGLLHDEIPAGLEFGLRKNYIVERSFPLEPALSPQALVDIACYDYIMRQSMDYLRQEIGDREITVDELAGIAKDYVYANLPDSLDERRKEHIYDAVVNRAIFGDTKFNIFQPKTRTYESGEVLITIERVD